MAQSIGIGAVKYADLSTDRIKDYVFDWDRMLAFDGNTAPYLQYAHARICSIFRRAEVERSAVRSATIVLGTPQERALALRVLALPTRASTTRSPATSPHRLCTYLFDLARTSPRSTSTVPCCASTSRLRTSRLALCDLIARTLAHGLGSARHRRARADVTPGTLGG